MSKELIKFAIQEQERLRKLQEERASLISPYMEDAQSVDFGSMQDDVWEAYFSTKKKNHEDMLAAKKKAEEEKNESDRRLNVMASLGIKYRKGVFSFKNFGAINQTSNQNGH